MPTQTYFLLRHFGKSMEYLKKLDTLIDCKHFIISFMYNIADFLLRHSM